MRYPIFTIHKISNYLISNYNIDKYGQYCPECDKNQPFKDWHCYYCGANSLAGDPFDDELENFDNEFESLQEKIIKLKCKTKRGNFIFEYVAQ